MKKMLITFFRFVVKLSFCHTGNNICSYDLHPALAIYLNIIFYVVFSSFSYLEVAHAELVLLADAADPVHQAIPLPLPEAATTGGRAVAPPRPGGPARTAARITHLRLIGLPGTAGCH